MSKSSLNSGLENSFLRMFKNCGVKKTFLAIPSIAEEKIYNFKKENVNALRQKYEIKKSLKNYYISFT